MKININMNIKRSQPKLTVLPPPPKKFFSF